MFSWFIIIFAPLQSPLICFLANKRFHSTILIRMNSILRLFAQSLRTFTYIPGSRSLQLTLYMLPPSRYHLSRITTVTPVHIWLLHQVQLAKATGADNESSTCVLGLRIWIQRNSLVCTPNKTEDEQNNAAAGRQWQKLSLIDQRFLSTHTQTL